MYRYDEQELPIIRDQYLSKIQLIANEPQSMNNFFKTLKFEMLTADSVDWMVSFVKMSGVQLLIRPLQELQRQGKKVRILTSTYLNITEPKALRKLMEFSNVEIKVYQADHESFHTKAYLFHRDSNLHSVIIGSSNLSHSALTNGHEWNVRIPSAAYLPIYQQAKEKFEKLWNDERAF
jgi:HKD family nuclease